MSKKEEIKTLTEYYVDKLIEEMGKIVTEEDGLTAKNISSIMLSLMIVIDECKVLTGAQKKEIILDTLRKYILNNLNPESEESKELLYMLEAILPNLINLMVSIDKRDISIAVKKTSALCPCFWKRGNRS